MESIYIPDFRCLQDKKKLLNPSHFWTNTLQSRLEINKKHADGLLQWCANVDRKLTGFHGDVSCGGDEIHRLLETYLTETKEEAENTIRQYREFSGKDGPIMSLKRLTDKKCPGMSDLKRLSKELASLTKQHSSCLKELSDIKEKGLRATATASSHEDLINGLNNRLDSLQTGSQKKTAKKIRFLEAKLSKQRQREHLSDLQYGSLLDEERELVDRLRKTSNYACTTARDLHKRQMETLVSALRDFVVKTSSDNSDRSNSLLHILDGFNISDAIGSSFESSSTQYIFPDVQDGRNQIDGDTNNNKTASCASRAAVDDGVQHWAEVHVRVICPFAPVYQEHLQLEPGMRILQKRPANEDGMSFGIYLPRLDGQKQSGFYPADHVIMEGV